MDSRESGDALDIDDGPRVAQAAAHLDQQVGTTTEREGLRLGTEQRHGLVNGGRRTKSKDVHIAPRLPSNPDGAAG